MALEIKDKAGIRATFKARPDLQEVHILPSSEHYFNKGHAEHALAEGEVLATLTADADELKDEVATPAKPAKT